MRASRSCVGRSLDPPTFGRIEAGVAALLQELGTAPRQFAPGDDDGHHEGQDKQHGDDDERPAAHSRSLSDLGMAARLGYLLES